MMCQDSIACVDIVYTWVNDSDPVWLAEKREYQRRAGKITFANNVARHNSNLNELLYSIRSLEMHFAGLYRNIYLVTNHGNAPNFLTRDFPNLIVVDQRDLLPGPCFSSIGIESVIHLIPGLSEHYLYLNDDMMLAQGAVITDFFEGGKPIWYCESNAICNFNNRYAWVSNLVDRDGGVTKSRRKIYDRLGIMPKPIGHCPRAFTKSLVTEFAESFSADVSELRKQPFRSADSFCFCDCFCFWAMQQGKLDYRSNYAIALLLHGEAKWVHYYNLLVLRANRSCKFLCVCDARERGEVDEHIREHLEERFPFRSKYECLLPPTKKVAAPPKAGCKGSILDLLFAL